MEDLLESCSLKDEGAEKEANPLISKVVEAHPLAFTIEFDDQKYDETKKSKVRERLSAFTLKHKRNPSLPDFRDFKNSKTPPSVERVVSVKSASFQHVSVFDKKGEKSGKPLEVQWKSTPLKAAKSFQLKSPLSCRANLGVKGNFNKISKVERSYSFDGNNDAKNACQNLILIHPETNIGKEHSGNIDDEAENRSDTVSEAGTYTVDKEENVENDMNRTLKLGEKEECRGDLNKVKKNYQSNWIKDWVRDVEKQNKLNSESKEPVPINCNNVQMENGSCCISKIPSPLNTLTKKAKPRCLKAGGTPKSNGSTFHKRSSSLGAKDSNGSHGSGSSLETESFLRATQSAMTSIQNRMKLSLERSPDLRRIEKRNFNFKERPHPPSTASDTDTNSETDAKAFKKPLGNPFTSARLNRAFSLRRAKADPEKELSKSKPFTSNAEANAGNGKQGSTSKTTSSKPLSSMPFSRLDCGRFSMRTTMPNIKQSNLTNQALKKEVKKSNAGNRSSSSLSAREVEFQNWRRRKSFDPMKAAAEGRKKEMAKRAFLNSSLTQSVNLGNAIRNRSGEGNPVLRSASFHSTAQVLGGEDDPDEFQEQESTDEQDESASSSWHSSRRSRTHNSPSQLWGACKPKFSTPVCGSRSSLVSETHSSPSRKLKSNDLENLVLSAICDSSYKLKSKSCKLLKKLNYLYDPGEEKSFRLKEEVAILESGQNSVQNSPVHQASSRDLFAILKNLKGVEKMFNVLEDVLFDENLEIYFRE